MRSVYNSIEGLGIRLPASLVSVLSSCFTNLLCQAPHPTLRLLAVCLLAVCLLLFTEPTG